MSRSGFIISAATQQKVDEREGAAQDDESDDADH
jgi:hypothetical protein